MPLAAFILSITGCRESPPPGEEALPSGQGTRIVSLSPAISRTLVDLGAGGYVVGRSPFCDALPESVPVVGDLNRIDYERLVRLDPTHVLLQPPSGGVDSGLKTLALERGFTLRGWGGLNGVVDIQRLLRELPAAVAEDGTDLRAGMEARSVEVLSALDDVLRTARKLPFPGRVMLVGGTNPVLAFGRGTYLDDVLQALGAHNAVSAQGWVQLSLEDVARIDPEFIVLIPAVTTRAEDDALLSLKALPVRAVETKRVAALRHPDALLPSSAIVDVAEALRRVLIELSQGHVPDAGTDSSRTPERPDGVAGVVWPPAPCCAPVT